MRRANARRYTGSQWRRRECRARPSLTDPRQPAALPRFCKAPGREELAQGPGRRVPPVHTSGSGAGTGTSGLPQGQVDEARDGGQASAGGAVRRARRGRQGGLCGSGDVSDQLDHIGAVRLGVDHLQE